MKQARHFLALAVSAVLALSACPLFTLGMPVQVVLPDLPSAWADAQGWELSWLSFDDSGGPVRAAPGSALELRLPRGGEAAVLCRAVYGNARTLPYGAPWPQGLSDDGLLGLDAAEALHPYLPTRYWLAFVDLFRDPILWRDVVRGLIVQLTYLLVFTLAAWASFSTSDIDE